MIIKSGGYWSEYGSTTYIGEVLNNLDTNVKLVKITMNLWDSNNNLIGSEYSYVSHTILHSKATSCVTIKWQENIALAKLTLDSITYYATTDSLPSMQLSNASLTANGDYYKALGIIKNNDVVTAKSVNSVNLIYNSTRLISCSDQNVASRDLAPGASSAFSEDHISLPPGFSPTSYRFMPDAFGRSTLTNAEPDFAPSVIDYDDEVVNPFQ